jgi:hypothetical protein
MTTRRIASILSAGLPALMLLAGLVAVGAASGGGGAIGATRVRALVVQHEETEDLVLAIDYDNARGPFAWIVPLPDVPEIHADPAWVLSVVEARCENRRLGRSVAGLQAAPPPVSTRQAPAPAQGEITEARIRSGDPAALLREIRSSGLDVLAADETALAECARRGWAFAVLRVNPPVNEITRSVAARGLVGPVRFGFRSALPACPLGTIAPPGSGQSAQVYAVTADPMVADGAWTSMLAGPVESEAWDALDPGLRFGALAASGGYLTACSIRGATRLPDLVLGPIDPLPDLRGSSEEKRAEAASCLGWTRARASLPALLAWLDEAGSGSRSRIASEDLLSGLWAVGEMGDTSGVTSLLAWTDAPDVLARVEALESLRRLGARRALPVFLRGLMRPVEPADPIQFAVERRSCLDGLVALGDPSVAPQLRGLASGNDGEHRWQTPTSAGRISQPVVDTDLGLWSIAALAAGGDAAAMDVMHRAIVKEGRERATLSWFEENAAKGGGISDFPRGFWGAKAILFKPAGRPDGWIQFGVAYDLLGARPAAREALLRGMANDPQLPDAARIVVLAHLEHAEAADLDTLAAIWARALEHGPFLEIPVPTGGSEGRPVRFNINACSVAYALARRGAVDRLLALAPTIAPADTMLRCEIVHALAWTEPPREVDRVITYVRDAWNRAAARPGVLEAQAHAAALLTDEVDIFGIYTGLDLPYRVRRITQFLCADNADPARLEALIADPALAPGLRLHWILNARYDRADRARLTATARAALEAIAAGAPHDTRITGLVAAARRQISANAIPIGI